MGKIYKTAMGKPVDLEAIRHQHENTVAVGNMGVNAKGDKLGTGGKVVETAHDKAVAYNRTVTKTVTKKSLKDPVDMSAVQEVDQPKPKRIKKREETLPDGSIKVLDPETDEGNSL